jgi:hypothetical protein
MHRELVWGMTGWQRGTRTVQWVAPWQLAPVGSAPPSLQPPAAALGPEYEGLPRPPSTHPAHKTTTGKQFNSLLCTWLRINFHSWMCVYSPTTRIPRTTPVVSASRTSRELRHRPTTHRRWGCCGSRLRDACSSRGSRCPLCLQGLHSLGCLQATGLGLDQHRSLIL